MEGHDVGNELARSVNHPDSAEEPGKSALFPLFQIWQETQGCDEDLCALAET